MISRVNLFKGLLEGQEEGPIWISCPGACNTHVIHPGIKNITFQMHSGASSAPHPARRQLEGKGDGNQER